MPTSQKRSRNWHRRRRNRALLRTGILAAAVSVMVIFGWGIGYLARELQDRFASGVYTIAVDAGHGGGDTGAVGVLRESDMTAQTAALLTQRLAADPHFHPVATRPEDTAATPAERSAAANQKHPDLLLSIHGNSDGNSADTVGFECYPVTPGRKEHDDSMRFASLLVQRMQAAGPPSAGQTASAMPTMTKTTRKPSWTAPTILRAARRLSRFWSAAAAPPCWPSSASSPAPPMWTPLATRTVVPAPPSATIWRSAIILMSRRTMPPHRPRPPRPDSNDRPRRFFSFFGRRIRAAAIKEGAFRPISTESAFFLVSFSRTSFTGVFYFLAGRSNFGAS